MINLHANTKLKSLGCKWSGSEWIATDLAKEEVKEIKDFYYSDLVVVKVTVKNGLVGCKFGYSHALLVAGYIVATASGRDSGGRVSEGAAIIEGRAKSGGSVKNYLCVIEEGVVIKMRVSKNLLDAMDKEVEERRYEYEILKDEESTESLLARKTLLLSQIEEINQKLKNLGEQE